MANQEHIEILNQGVETWNRWRVENPNIEPDLSDHSFTGKIINNEPQVKLQGADLKKANLAGSRLRLADLREADLSEANLQKANLSGAFLTHANLTGANLSAAILQGANFSAASMNKAILRGADLSKGIFMGQEFHFEKMVFEIPRWRRGSYFFQQSRKTTLDHVALNEADLTGANCSGADFGGASLRDANLFATILRGADLRAVDLYGACLYETNLNSANLENTDFDHSKLKSTYFINIDLSKSRGLDNVRHDGPSTICLDTLFRSHGHIPESFFRGVGFPDSFIELLESFLPDDFGHPSCYIISSSLDLNFAQKLQLDLQQEGIRTWLVPDDIAWGDPKNTKFDRDIQQDDRLLFVFSQDSVNSNWVEREVEHALDLERRICADMDVDELSVQILFPIMIDSSILDTKQFWAKKIREARHIENFSEWQNNTAYKSTFEKLLRDLENSSKENPR